MPLSSRFVGCAAALLRLHRLDAGNVAAHLAHARGVLQLPGSALETQVELFLLQFTQLIFQLVDRHVPELFRFHDLGSWPLQACRLTMRVLIGSLAAPSPSASRAVPSVTPSSSNMMRPGLTRATHSSGAPLPEPMRTSAGFLVTGTSGKTRIQTRPVRFMPRVMARRAASIWRAVSRSGSIALRP